ncbi:CocE/NonD family hydrolase [Streptomyces sp. NPDC048288]|uniref:CocE/NonD family hydrolase n=1 Tax=Streptomyces sp. NPDC048288 TaxID=3365529 RepID=UPI0037132C77
MSPGAPTDPSPVPDHAAQYFVRMRDGAHLATDVYLPPNEAEPVQAVLVRLPYDKNSRYVFMEAVARRLTARGYALVVQDVRGKYRSDGEPIGPLTEVNDGYDTIDWIAAQCWCDGRVGMFGDSYYGFTQWAALSSGHPALRAIVPRMTSTDIPRFAHVEHGGVIDVPWLQFVKYIAQCWTGPYLHEAEPDWSRAPLTDVFDSYFDDRGERSLWYDLMVPVALPVPVYHNGHPHQARPVPTLHCVGWFDNVANLSMRDYTALTARPTVAPFHYLHAEATDHENYHLQDVPIGPERDHNTDDIALERMLDGYLGPALKFFDVFLKETADPSSFPRVQWRLGHADLRESVSWPPPGSRTRTLYLTELARAQDGGGTLTDDAPAHGQVCEWRYDPENLVRSTSVNSFALLFENPDEAGLSEHPDVLGFATEPVTDPVDLAGPVDLYVRVSSSAPTTDIYAKLCDRAPDGTLRQIVRGQGILRTPGEDEPARIEMGHTGYRLRPGHSLHLLISSSDYPEFPPNPGTDENRWTARERVGSRQVLHTDGPRPSHLTVTVLP